MGTGCSKIAGLPLTEELTAEVSASEEISDCSRKILEAVQNQFEGASSSANIEDVMSEVVDFLSISHRRKKRNANNPNVSIGELVVDSGNLELALVEIKRTIASAIAIKPVAIETHRKFAKTVHASLEAGKNQRQIDYFVLNYDTLLEDSLGLERVTFSDGFVGAATGWWEPSSFRKREIAARVFKVHGSIDWCLLENDTLPRRVRPGIINGSMPNHVLIYPAATKYQETQRDPFAQILQYMRESLSPPEGKEKVLGICGYSFGDSHINLEVENALVQSNGRLTVVVFVGTDEPEGRLKGWLDNPDIADQMWVYTNKGYFHGSIKIKKDFDLSWWKFEVLTQLLGGAL